MNSTKQISVIVPVCNGAKYLAQCVRSVFSQTVRSIQLIIVNDGSTDSTPELIRELGNECPPEMEYIVHAHEQSQGVSEARNKGLALASGTYLFFIDSDDWITPLCLEQLKALMEENQADVVCGTYQLFSQEEGYYNDLSMEHPDAVYEGNEIVLRAYCERKVPVFIWNKLIRRSFFLESGMRFESAITNDEDQLWCFRLVLRASKWVSSSQATYYYRQDNPTSITARSKTSVRLGNYFNVLSFMTEDVGNLQGMSESRAVLVARSLLKFTKSILWHIECDESVDHRSLYKEFKRRNVFRLNSPFLSSLHGKYRYLAMGWSLPYPLVRLMNPCYLSKRIRPDAVESRNLKR